MQNCRGSSGVSDNMWLDRTRYDDKCMCSVHKLAVLELDKHYKHSSLKIELLTLEYSMNLFNA